MSKPDSLAARGPAAEQLARLAERYWEFCCHEQPFAVVLGGQIDNPEVLFRESLADYTRRVAGAKQLLELLAQVDQSALAIEDLATAMLMQRELEMIVLLAANDDHLRPSLYPAGPDFNLSYFSRAMNADSVAAAERYLRLLGSFAGYVDDLLGCLQAGIDSGYRYPLVVIERMLAAVRGATASDALPAQLLGPFERSVIRESARISELRDAVQRCIDDVVMPAFARYEAFVDGPLRAVARDTDGLAGDRGGDELYRALVRRFSSTEEGPEAMHALGLTEVERLSAALLEQAGIAGFENDLAGYRDYLNSDVAFRAVDQASHIGTVRALCKEIDGKIPALFRELPRITYTVELIPEAVAANAPAAYAQPSPSDGSAPGIFWISSLTDQCPTYLYPSLALHEAWPGHLMQIALMEEQQDLPAFRRNGSLKYTSFVEGWAMYCEELGDELGLYRTPHEQFGRLSMEIWRAARLVVDTGIHLHGWTRQQAIDYMQPLVTLSPDAVAAEVDRYIALPAQALGYQPGNLLFRELRARATRRLGDHFDLRDFHQALISSGPVSLPVLDMLMEDWISQRETRAVA